MFVVYYNNIIFAEVVNVINNSNDFIVDDIDNINNLIVKLFKLKEV